MSVCVCVACSYRSLHTVVHVEEGVSVEVQIRTREMHYQAEYGLAAHWRYKEGDAEYPASLQNMYDYQRWVLTFQAEVADTKCRVTPATGSMQPPCPFPTHLKTCCYSEEHGEGSAALTDSDCDPVYIVLFENEGVSRGTMIVALLMNETRESEVRKARERCLSFILLFLHLFFFFFFIV